ncbi:hypothetical protein Ciccas_001414 [Cichlidogyrus casuarinus]|uniref:Uncharacterized protein n=1 Tax=Cichlidogyrus casuarinus TaxID=1844966 RepID=A0ABD2QK58_9PLAT
MFNGPFDALREIEKLKKEIGILNVQCYGYKETLKKYGFRNDDNLAKLDALKQKVAQIPLMRQEFESKITILECQIQAFKDENVALKKELDSLKHSNFSKITNSNEIYSEVTLLKEQLQTKSLKVQRLEAQNIERDAITASQANKLAILEAAHAQLSGEMSTQKNFEISLKNQILSLNRDLSEMRVRLRERDSKLEEAEEELATCHEIIRNYEETVTLKKELECGDEVHGPLHDLQQQIRGFVSMLNKTLVGNSICSFVEQSLHMSREFSVAKPIPEDRALDLKVAASLLTNLASDLDGEAHPLNTSQKELSVFLDCEKENATNDDSLINLLRSISKTPKPAHRRHMYKKKPAHQNLNTTISIPSHLKSLKNQLNQLVATEEEQHSDCNEASMVGELTMNIKQKSDLSRQMLQTVKELETLFENIHSEKQQRLGQCVVAFAAEPTEVTCTISKDLTSPTMSDMDEQASVVYEENLESVCSVPENARITNIPIHHSTAVKKSAEESTLYANDSAQFDGILPVNSLKEQLVRFRSDKERLEEDVQQLMTALEQNKCELASLQNTSLQQQTYIRQIEDKLSKTEQDLEDWQVTCEEQEKSLQNLDKVMALKNKEMQELLEIRENLEKKLEETHRLFEDYQSKSKLKEEEAEKLRAAQKDKIIELEDESNGLHTKLSSLELTIREMEREKETLQERIVRQREEETSLLNKIESLMLKREDGLGQTSTEEKYKRLKAVTVELRGKLSHRTK